VNLLVKGIEEFEKLYPFIELSEKDKTLVSLAYYLGYADSKINTYGNNK
jgi:hypothetical protein